MSLVPVKTWFHFYFVFIDKHPWFFTLFYFTLELSEVLWNMVLHLAFGMKGGLGVIASFALFAVWAGEFQF